MDTQAARRRRRHAGDLVGVRPGRTLVGFVVALLLILGAAAFYTLRSGTSAPAQTTTADRPPAEPTATNAAATAASAESAESPESAATSDATPAAPPAETLFEGWDEPRAALVFTARQHGYLEPCGCTAGQVGGLARRADLVRQLRDERRWPVAGFDVGGLLRNERAKRPQEGIKFEFTRMALSLMDYDAQALGEEELRFGADQLFTLFSDEQGKGEPRPKFVCANLTLFEERTDQYALEIPEQFRLVEIGGLKVGVTAIVGEEAWNRVFPGGLTVADTLYAFEPPATALQRVIPLLQAEQPDLLILLSHTSTEASRTLVEQFPVFDAVVTAGGPEDGRREPGRDGKTLILEVGQKGKTAGVLGVFPDADQKLRFQLVELSRKHFAHAPQIHELLQQYVQRLDERHPELQEPLGAHPTGAEYVGADACAECHQDAYDVWKESKHSHSFESLSIGRADAEDDTIFTARIHDPECITCHAVGWDPLQFARYDSAFVDTDSTPRLAGTQCENCHGPASRHVAEEQAVAAGGNPTAELLKERAALHIDVEWSRVNLCVTCHDLDNSPRFDTEEKPFDDWWAEIAH